MFRLPEDTAPLPPRQESPRELTQSHLDILDEIGRIGESLGEESEPAIKSEFVLAIDSDLSSAERSVIADMMAEDGPLSADDLAEAQALNQQIAAMTPAELEAEFGPKADLASAAQQYLDKHYSENLERWRERDRVRYATDKGGPVRSYRRDLATLTPEERLAHRRAQKKASKAKRGPDQVQREREANKVDQQNRRRDKRQIEDAERAKLAIF